MKSIEVTAARRVGGVCVLLALTWMACHPSSQPPTPTEPDPSPLLYVSDYLTLHAAVFDTSEDESPPRQQIGVPLTTTYPLFTLDTAHDQIAVADTQGIRFYARDADGPPQAVRTIPWTFNGPLYIAASAEKNWLIVIDLRFTTPPGPFGPRDVLVDVYTFPLDASGPTQPLRTESWSEPTSSGHAACRPAIDFAREELFTCMGATMRVDVYPLSGSGQVSPLRDLRFDTVVAPSALSLDTHNGRLYAASVFSRAVTVYDSSASGQVTALRTFDDVNAFDLGVDPEHDELVTISKPDNRLSVYPLSGSGTVAPLRSFLAEGSRVEVDPARGEYIVGSDSRLSTYARLTTEGGGPLRRIWDGGPSYPAGIVVNPAERTLLMVHGSGFVETYPLSGGEPVRTLRGPGTGLDNARAIALAPQRGELFVSNSRSITVHPVGASGNEAPRRVISGQDTGLDSPWGLAVDEAHGELYVANWLPPYTIHVYALDANGNVHPTRTISGPDTGLDHPRGLALDLEHDELLVANYGGSVTVYPRLADGNVAPLRTLGGLYGSAESLGLLTAITYDPAREEMYLANVGVARVRVFSRLATGTTPALRSFSSGLKGPTGLALLYE